MGLIDIIKKGGIALGLAGTLALNGCANWEPGPLHPSKLLFDGTVFSRQNQQQTLYVTKQNNVYTQNNLNYEQLQNSPKKRQFFVCNEVRDLDNNGIVDYPYDLKGIKEGDIIEASEDENICFVGIHIAPERTMIVQPSKKMFDIKFIMLYENDEVAYQQDNPIMDSPCSLIIDFGKGRIPAGNYKVYFVSTETNKKEEMKLRISKKIVSANN